MQKIRNEVTKENEMPLPCRHGFTDHIGTVAHVARAYAEAGYAAYGLDFPGHGRSEGLRG